MLRSVYRGSLNSKSGRNLRMNIPALVADFFRMKNEQDHDGLWALFASDATVVDGGEGKKVQGAEEIKKWIQKALSGLNLHTEICDCKEESGEWVVDTVMTGDFKASPARFEYFITVTRNKISALRVEFRGSLR
jgi:ketosteroid isomerase-like protein